MAPQERLPYEWTAGLVPTIPAEQARPRILAMRAQGLGPTAIARRLNVDGVSTPTGRGRWYSETVTRHADPAGHAAYMRAYRRRRRG